jgi:hypothetical protein
VSALILAGAAAVFAGLGSSYIVPVDHEAIQYSKGPVDDVVSRLQQRLDRGEVRLKYEDEFGYLRSVLHELGVPASSQVLVFSKTSFQAPRIAPRMPRALYFNNEVTVGFVRTGEVLEFAAVDPKQGVMFYTLDQERTAHPRFSRQDVCLQCHQSNATQGVPGLVVRSVTPDRTGMPVMSEGGYITDHTSPLSQRWGGWYVTGESGSQTHMGNAIQRVAPDSAAGNYEHAPITDGIANVTDLKPFLDTGAYISPHSDIVALMTLEHQSQMVNLMTRVGWEARIAMAENLAINRSVGEPETQVRESTAHRIDAAVEELVEYMLFRGEAKLTAAVKGTSGFAEEFAKAGVRDAKGRSLRDFDLKARMFRYPCSYMIYSEEFDAMPPEVLARVYRRLGEVLSGRDSEPTFAYLSTDDRAAIREIVRATKSGLPRDWAE